MFVARVTEVIAVSVLATVVTAIIAAPVLRAPSERVFGMEIVGRHHDPFTVMEQFDRPITVGVYSQPVTDIAGALFARVWGAVAAYNWLVLLSFPLSAAAAYLLARHLTLSPAGAGVAAMAFAFSPFHLAHAGGGPHSTRDRAEQRILNRRYQVAPPLRAVPEQIGAGKCERRAVRNHVAGRVRRVGDSYGGDEQEGPDGDTQLANPRRVGGADKSVFHSGVVRTFRSAVTGRPKGLHYI